MENIDNYKDLANAIIVCAADDYRGALKTLKDKPFDYAALKSRHSCERFFLSNWFSVLTNLNGKEILEKLNQEQMEEIA